MLSKKLESLAATTEAAAATAAQQQAAANLRDALREGATRQCCYRCERAGFVAGWDSKHQRWWVTHVTCSAGHSLPQGELFGLESPGDFLFCTAESSDSATGSGLNTFDDLAAAGFVTRSHRPRDSEREPGRREAQR